MTHSLDRILWLDCIGGLVFGCAVLSLCWKISELENLPVSVVVIMGIANLVYGGYSLFTTTRHPRPKKLIKILAIANMAWFFACLSILLVWWQEMSILGLIHVFGEGVYVAVLGFIEWQLRERLSQPKTEIAG